MSARTRRVAIASSYAVLGSILLWSRLAGLNNGGFCCDEIATVVNSVRAGPGPILTGPYTPNNHELYSLLGWATSSIFARVGDRAETRCGDSVHRRRRDRHGLVARQDDCALGPLVPVVRNRITAASRHLAPRARIRPCLPRNERDGRRSTGSGTQRPLVVRRRILGRRAHRHVDASALRDRLRRHRCRSPPARGAPREVRRRRGGVARRHGRLVRAALRRHRDELRTGVRRGNLGPMARDCPVRSDPVSRAHGARREHRQPIVCDAPRGGRARRSRGIEPAAPAPRACIDPMRRCHHDGGRLLDHRHARHPSVLQLPPRSAPHPPRDRLRIHRRATADEAGASAHADRRRTRRATRFHVDPAAHIGSSVATRFAARDGIRDPNERAIRSRLRIYAVFG